MRLTLLRRHRPLLTCASLTLASGSAHAVDVYVGAEIGHSDHTYIESSGSTEQATAWKVLVGLHELRFLATEIECIDYGSASFTASGADQVFGISLLKGPVTGTVRTRGYGVRELGVLPAGRYFDFFAGAGWQYERAALTQSGTNILCASGTSCILTESETRGAFAFAYGAGVEVKLASLALRAEYEGALAVTAGFPVIGDYGHPGFYSVGLTFTF